VRFIGRFPMGRYKSGKGRLFVFFRVRVVRMTFSIAVVYIHGLSRDAHPFSRPAGYGVSIKAPNGDESRFTWITGCRFTYQQG
jgi:hypothetical protein